jgi:hypothetical protein
VTSVKYPINVLGSYVLFRDVTSRWVVVLYRCFGTSYRFHLQGSRSPRRTYCLLKVGQKNCPETSIQKYHSTLRNAPEERRSHLQRGGSLKSRKCVSPWLWHTYVSENELNILNKIQSHLNAEIVNILYKNRQSSCIKFSYSSKLITLVCSL